MDISYNGRVIVYIIIEGDRTMTVETIKVEKATTLKQKPESIADFGTVFTDHMFMMDYSEERGWHDPRIVPYGDIHIDPAAMIFHYGQSVFEGLKAYLTPDGDVHLFRPEKNFARMNHSNKRL